MAKRSRKSRRGRKGRPKGQPARRQPGQRAAAPPATVPAPHAGEAATAAPVAEVATRASTVAASRRGVRGAIDFMAEYAYVYHDLRKMFTIAILMFVLLVVVNLIVTRFIVL